MTRMILSDTISLMIFLFEEFTPENCNWTGFEEKKIQVNGLKNSFHYHISKKAATRLLSLNRNYHMALLFSLRLSSSFSARTFLCPFMFSKTHTR